MIRFLLLVLLLGTLPLRAEVHGGWEVCACKAHLGRVFPYDPEADHRGNERRYARDREIDVKHVKLELDPDFAKRSLAGKATLTFTPIATPLAQLRLDAVDLRVSAVESSAALKDWTIGASQILLTFVEAISAGVETTVTLAYTAEPQDGWFFRTAAMGYPEGDDHFFTQGEPERHRHWFPGYDYPNERFTSEVICRVPKGMTVLSNGRLVEEGQVGDQTLFHWKQEQEHVNYLISVVGGHFKKLEAKHGDLPLGFLTTPSQFAEAPNSFTDTAAIIAFFEKETGVPYPWAKYYSVCVADFIAGGMENTSVTTLTDRTLFSKETETLRSSHQLDAHEAAHQWFGDLVTCKDWSQIWLNEGFATYYTHLYDGEKFGADEMRYQLWLDARDILSNLDERPIVWRGYRDPMEQFDYRAYPKGGWVLHMLRSQLGPERFRECIRAYLEEHRNQNVVTQDLLDVIETRSGRDWDEFFDQWVHHGGEPALKVSYSWDANRMQARLAIEQTQKISDAVLLFDFPLPVRFIDEKGGRHDFTVRIHEKSEDFHFTLPAKPTIVRLDPETTVLASFDFKLPNPMLHAQLAGGGDLTGRLLATVELGGRSDSESLGLLETVLRSDAHYGVRIEAARALAKTHTPESLAILTGSLDQPDARARQAVVDAIGKFYSASAFAALRKHLTAEKNPDMVATTLAALSGDPDKATTEAILAMLDRPSHRSRIAAAAVDALRRRGETVVLPAVLAHLREQVDATPSFEFGGMLEDLGSLARFAEDEDKEAARTFLLGQLESRQDPVRRSAIVALGALGDPRSVEILQPIVDALDPERSEAKAAREAIAKLAGTKPQSSELGDLRGELLRLQDETRALKGQIEALRKETTPEKPSPASAK